MINQTLTEAKEGKNDHLEHIEDMVFNEGVTGTRNAILFLRSIRDMLSGTSSRSVNITTKWDGAPAIFAGVDPADGAFFVAKKGLFNADPQMYQTVEDVKSKLSGELQDKFLVALQEFSKLGIKSGVYQGDLMFTKSDLSKEKIDGQHYLTFQPNTIVYAVPAASPLARKIRKAKIGVVWHTTYSGKTIQDMEASFGQSIVSKLKSVASVSSKSKLEKHSTYLLVAPLIVLLTTTQNSSSVSSPDIDAALSQTAMPFPKTPPKICLCQATTFSDL